MALLIRSAGHQPVAPLELINWNIILIFEAKQEKRTENMKTKAAKNNLVQFIYTAPSTQSAEWMPK